MRAYSRIWPARAGRRWLLREVDLIYSWAHTGSVRGLL